MEAGRRLPRDVCPQLRDLVGPEDFAGVEGACDAGVPGGHGGYVEGPLIDGDEVAVLRGGLAPRFSCGDGIIPRFLGIQAGRARRPRIETSLAKPSDGGAPERARETFLVRPSNGASSSDGAILTCASQDVLEDLVSESVRGRNPPLAVAKLWTALPILFIHVRSRWLGNPLASDGMREPEGTGISKNHIHPSTIRGIKRLAKELKTADGLIHAKALDKAASLAGFENFAHARRRLPRPEGEDQERAVRLSVDWRTPDAAAEGCEAVTLRLRTSVLDLIRDQALEVITRDHVRHTKTERSRDWARELACFWARVLTFMDVTGLRPGTVGNEVGSGDGWLYCLPDADHLSVWVDPPTGTRVTVDEPTSCRRTVPQNTESPGRSSTVGRSRSPGSGACTPPAVACTCGPSAGVRTTWTQLARRWTICLRLSGPSMGARVRK